ncbi:MAG TPA: flagellar export chaperone FliS [Verrucomicrobiae bacterium]|nr:flagellar export chaperone FliS [Verrucomicrobiae bacterium]
MNSQAAIAHSYRRIATETASPAQRVAMLYDGAINFLERALLGFRNEDPLEFNLTIHNNIQRAQAIIRELNSALNLEAGGELAATLRRLYLYFDWRLDQSNRLKTAEGIQEIITRLTTLRDAWGEMLLRHELAGAPAR